MNNDIYERVLQEANHILSTHDTIRKTAQIFGRSKSSVHSDVSIKLRTINPYLHDKVKPILEENFLDKHNRGGRATKEKYAKKPFFHKITTTQIS